jgi:hypothetical protein
VEGEQAAVGDSCGAALAVALVSSCQKTYVRLGGNCTHTVFEKIRRAEGRRAIRLPDTCKVVKCLVYSTVSRLFL